MRAEQEGPLALCAETEFSAGDAAETDPAERSGALRTEDRSGAICFTEKSVFLLVNG